MAEEKIKGFNVEKERVAEIPAGAMPQFLVIQVMIPNDKNINKAEAVSLEVDPIIEAVAEAARRLGYIGATVNVGVGFEVSTGSKEVN